MSTKIELLQEEIIKTGEICAKLNLYIEMIHELQKSDVARAILVCKEAIALAQQPEHAQECKEELTSCLVHLGMLNARNGNYLDAISITYDAIPQIEMLSDRYLQARALNVIAASNGYLGNYYEALNHFMKALEIFKEIGDKTWEAAVLNNIGYQYWHLENYEWALKYLNMSLSQAEKLDQKSLHGDVCETLCNVYYTMGDYKQALNYGLRSLALYQEVQDGHGEAEVLNSLGDSYQALDQTGKAIECFRNALALARETGHKHEEVETLLRMGKYFTATEAYDQAQGLLNLALENAGKLEIKRSIYECHLALADLAKKTDSYQEALEHHEKFFEYYQQVYGEAETLRIQSLEVMHQVDTARKDAEIYRLKNVALQIEIDERKKAQDALRSLAITDPLTGLYNRRYFFELAEDAFQRAKWINPQLSVILIDVDNFKNVNDHYGHAVGDEVLMKLAKIMQESLRKFDVVARYGGEEFVILLSDTQHDQAKEVAERLRSRVESEIIQVGKHQIRLGVSVGLAFFDELTDLNLEALLNHADMSMYEAKQAGGNRVHVWGTGILYPR